MTFFYTTFGRLHTELLSQVSVAEESATVCDGRYLLRERERPSQEWVTDPPTPVSIHSTPSRANDGLVPGVRLYSADPHRVVLAIPGGRDGGEHQR